ncbi:MAG: hypothetical protein F4112_07630 [Holophagales bacterium]|nr:hypothetical protein [Holophagales bacterium]MYD22115.1 hypothetical protein [Holophagales bacterium]MYI32822.1 hypothetical protein [Holophagales bacterium]
MKCLIAILLAVLATAAPANAVEESEAEGEAGKGGSSKRANVVYGIGVSGHYYDSDSDPDYVPVRTRSVVPAFAVAALWDIDGRYEVGPMFLSNVDIGGSEGASVTFDSIGFGLMVALRDGSQRWLNGLGLGIAYSLDREVEYRHRLKEDMTKYVVGHSTSVVVTYSFGRSRNRTSPRNGGGDANEPPK